MRASTSLSFHWMSSCGSEPAEGHYFSPTEVGIGCFLFTTHQDQGWHRDQSSVIHTGDLAPHVGSDETARLPLYQEEDICISSAFLTRESGIDEGPLPRFAVAFSRIFSRLHLFGPLTLCRRRTGELEWTCTRVIKVCMEGCEEPDARSTRATICANEICGPRREPSEKTLPVRWSSKLHQISACQ